MKRLMLISLLVVVAMTVSAQKQKGYFDLDNDTIKADTNYYPSATGYEIGGADGVIIFEFTHTDVADSLKYVRIEGKVTTEWVALTGTAVLAYTSTDGTDQVYTSTPLPYRYYRAFLAAASGDTVAITNPYFVYKRSGD